MKSAVLPITTLLLILLGISGCTVQQPGTVTVSGTVTAPFWGYYITSGNGNPIVTVSGGGRSYSVLVPVSGSSGSETFSYSISSVPTGTYSVTVTVISTFGGSTGSTYSVNGAPFLPVSSERTTGGPTVYAYTIEIDNITINANTQIDLMLPSIG